MLTIRGWTNGSDGYLVATNTTIAAVSNTMRVQVSVGSPSFVYIQSSNDAGIQAPDNVTLSCDTNYTYYAVAYDIASNYYCVISCDWFISNYFGRFPSGDSNAEPSVVLEPTNASASGDLRLTNTA